MQQKWLQNILFGDKSYEAEGFSAWLLRPARLFYHVGREFHYRLCFERAASVTFATILSLIPLAVLFFSFSEFIGQSGFILKYVKESLIPLVAPKRLHGEIGLWLEQVPKARFGEVFDKNVKQALVAFIALGTLVVAALGVVLTAERNFNRIWRTRSRRSYLQKFTVFWVILTISPLVLVVSTQIDKGLVPTDFLQRLPILAVIYEYLVPFLLGGLGFTVLYLFLPSADVQLRSALLGGALAALLWMTSKEAFVYYLSNAHDIYGKLGIVPLFLVWVYVSWLVILFGCVFVYVHQNRQLFSYLGRKLHRVSAVPLSFVGVYIVERLARAFGGEGSRPGPAKLAQELGVRLERVEEAAGFLSEGGLLVETANPTGYALLRAPGETTLREVIELLPQEDYPGELVDLARKATRAGAADLVSGSLQSFQVAREAYLAAFGQSTLAEGTAALEGVDFDPPATSPRPPSEPEPESPAPPP